MVDPSKFDDLAADLAKKLADLVPEELSGRAREVRQDMERNFKGLLSSAVERMELVTREEFEAQREVLRRTEEKLTSLAERLESLASGGDTDQDS